MISKDLKEIFSNQCGSVFQSDKNNCFFIDFEGKCAYYQVSTLYQLKEKLERFSIEDIFAVHSSNPSGIEIVAISTTDYCYILNPLQIIRFKELLEGAFTMLKLNQIICNALHYSVLA